MGGHPPQPRQRGPPGPAPPRPGLQHQGAPGAVMPNEDSPEKRRLAEETRNERQVWYFLGYFLFGIHVIAFVMIYAVRHAK
ncbi:hypothetical protein [Streptomyces diastatochromogenes]|uniref:hypothetical protein n=1 Tax=Streptomyces diastatochromogenes TaxID=42236 RepID=UPI003CC53591